MIKHKRYLVPLKKFHYKQDHQHSSVIDRQYWITLDQRTPRTRSRAKRSLSETIVPPMVHGITPEESSSDQGRTQSQSKFKVYVPMTQSIVGGTDGNKISQIPTCTAVELLTQFTQTIQGDSVITTHHDFSK